MRHPIVNDVWTLKIFDPLWVWKGWRPSYSTLQLYPFAFIMNIPGEGCFSFKCRNRHSSDTRSSGCWTPGTAALPGRIKNQKKIKKHDVIWMFHPFLPFPRTREEIGTKIAALQFTCQVKKSWPLQLHDLSFGANLQCPSMPTWWTPTCVILRYFKKMDSWHFIVWLVDRKAFLPAAPFLKSCVDFSCSNYKGRYSFVKLLSYKVANLMSHEYCNTCILLTLHCITEATDPKFGFCKFRVLNHRHRNC